MNRRPVMPAAAQDNHGYPDVLEHEHVDNCPACGSGDIEGHQVSIEDPLALQPCTCNACGTRWTGVYKYIGCSSVEIPPAPDDEDEDDEEA